jgi:hypothetical protein
LTDITCIRTCEHSTSTIIARWEQRYGGLSVYNTSVNLQSFDAVACAQHWLVQKLFERQWRIEMLVTYDDDDGFAILM